MVNKEDIIKLLNEKNIEFELVEHEAVYTMEDIEKLNIKDKGTEVKNLFLRDEKGKNHFLIVAKEDTKIDMKELKNIINSSKLSFASEERLEKYLKLKRGSVSPFGILNDDQKAVKVFIDKNLEKDNISNKEITKKIISYAVPFVIINIIVDIYSITDSILILNTLTGLGYVAEDVEFIASCISTWGSKICMVVNAIAMGMTMSLIPSIVEAYSTKNVANLNKRINEALQMVVYISLPLTIGISILSTPIWTIFYNTNAYGGSILKITIFGAMLGNVTMIISCTLQGMNKYKHVYLMNLIGSLTNATLDVPLMILFNKLNLPAYYGASVSSIIGYTTSTLIGLKYINKDKNISYKETIKVIFKSLIPALSMLVVLLIINHFIPLDVYKKFDAIILIIINAIIGGIIYIYLSFKLNIPYQIFGKEYLNKIIKKLTFGKLK